MSKLPELRWGIIGCGIISSRFVHDLCLDRADAPVKHVVKAIGSSSISKGSKFASENCPLQQPSVYGTYQGVYNDPDVDIVYIGTPHVLHLQNAMDAISARKHVVCEKPMTMNAATTQALIDAAREKGVFLMEAVWTRFFPLTKELQRLLHKENVIGDIARVFVDFGSYMPIDKADPSKRTASKALGAGALLDIGVYTLTWASIVLDESQRHKETSPVGLAAGMTLSDPANAEAGVDEQVSIVLTYPDIKAQAVCTASLLYKSPEQFARIEGSKGTVIIGGAAPPKPLYLLVRVKGQEEQRIEMTADDYGFYFEADAAARDILAGRIENETCSLKHTLTIMSRMDSVRTMCGLVYPGE